MFNITQQSPYAHNAYISNVWLDKKNCFWFHGHKPILGMRVGIIIIFPTVPTQILFPPYKHPILFFNYFMRQNCSFDIIFLPNLQNMPSNANKTS
jgi:hypothetical protein